MKYKSYKFCLWDSQDGHDHSHNKECQMVIDNLHEKLDACENHVKKGEDSLAKLEELHKRKIDKVKLESIWEGFYQQNWNYKPDS